MPVSPREKMILAFQSGNICAFPECNQSLVVENNGSDGSIVGEAAHIKGENPTAARYDENMTDGERNHPDNLIYLCRIHHKIIDDQENLYTVDKLLKMKDDHKKWVIENTRKSLIDVTFAELEVITKYLLSAVPTVDSIEIICPREKIKRNKLSKEIEGQIISGMARVSLVRDYINKSIDSEFGERLKQGFIDEYIRLTKEGLREDALFDALLYFASNGSRDFKNRAAALVILVYFFEQCDIFEK